MSPDCWRQVALLYRSSLEREAGERAAFLSSACKDDEDLQREVELLLSEPQAAQ
jgi:hypothetical protein